MSIYPDNRIRPSGNHPDLGGYKHVGGRTRPSQFVIAEARELAKLVNTGPPETPPAAREYSGVEDAANMLGLDAAKTAVAEGLLRDVINDTRDMLSISKAALDAGIPREIVPLILRRGLSLRYRKLSKGRAKPIGTHSRQGGQEVVKEGEGKWVPVPKGRAAAKDQPPGQKGAAPAPSGQRSPGGDPNQSAPPKGPSNASPQAQAQSGGSGAEEVPPEEPAGPDRHKAPKKRFEEIKGKAKAAGKQIHGEFNEETHGHEHMDQLEQDLVQHIVDGLANKHGMEVQTPDASEGAESPSAQVETPSEASGPEEVPRDDKGRPQGHDKPESVHDESRQRQQVQDLLDRLSSVEKRLEGPHQKGMYDQLHDDAKKVEKNPSPQAISWLDTRIVSFLTFVTGVAAGAASGGAAGALAGGVHGEAAQVSASQSSKVMQGAEAAAQKVRDSSGGLKRFAEDENKDEAKKALVIGNGRLLLALAAADLIAKGGWQPIPGGKHGGERRLVGGRYQYRYPSAENAAAAVNHHASRAGQHRQTAQMHRENGRDRQAQASSRRAQEESEIADAAQQHARLSKAKPPGAGWHPIPGGKKGGFRRRKGSGYEYMYPDSTGQTTGGRGGRVQLSQLSVKEEKHRQAQSEYLRHREEVEDHFDRMNQSALETVVRGYASLLHGLEDVADRVWHGVVHTAKEFPDAARGIGKLIDGDPLSKHEMLAIVSVGTMIGTAALYASSYGGAAAGGAFGKKFITHVAMSALSGHLNDAYTAYGAYGFVDKLAYVLSKADDEEGEEEGRTATDEEMKALVLGVLTEMRNVLNRDDWTPEKVKKIVLGEEVPLTKSEAPVALGLRKGARAPHPKNAYGHRDGLEPGMVLWPRARHEHCGPIDVLPDGAFLMKGERYSGNHALLSALHGSADHRTTVRRYFKLGGERSAPQVDVVEPLRQLMKAEGVLVQRTGTRYSLTGDLQKAGVPDYLLGASPNHTTIDHAAAIDLCRFLGVQNG